jgi:hypothetical protein
MLQAPFLNEASGICRSNVVPGRYFVHNDSGAAPRLFAVTADGARGGFSVAPLKRGTVDAEDCASAVVQGVPLLLLADVGDNACARKSYRMYVMREPPGPPGPPGPAGPGGPESEILVQPLHTLSFRYPDGKSRNCEAVALLPTGRIVVITKRYPPASGPTTLYEIDSPLNGSPVVRVSPGLRLPESYGTITGADVLGDRMVLLGLRNGRGVATVLHATTYAWIGEAAVPAALQREGICFSAAGDAVIVVSERDRKMTTTRLLPRLQPTIGSHTLSSDSSGFVTAAA